MKLESLRVCTSEFLKLEVKYIELLEALETSMSLGAVGANLLAALTDALFIRLRQVQVSLFLIFRCIATISKSRP